MTTRLAELVELGGTVATVTTAQESGLMDSLARPALAKEHAARLNLDPSAVSLVLDVLVALGVAERKGRRIGVYDALSSDAHFLVGDVLSTQALWSHLPQFLQTGDRHAHMDGPAGERSATYQQVVGSLGRLFENAALELARRLPPPGERVLDVGAGSGVWSLAMCARSPSAKLFALDLPAVLPACLERARSLGLAERVEQIAGDYHSIELPAASFDRIILANVLHLESPADAASLITRAADALKPAGELVVIDSLADDDPILAPARAIYALHLAMRTHQGRVHPRTEISRWARAASLSDGRLIVPQAPPLGIAALVYRAVSATPKTPARRRRP